jgi:molybdenum cofactor synthesis domain-containing protein
MRTAAALIIGNELLSGKIADANLVVLARELRALGVQLRRVVMVLDEVATIVREVRDLAATHDWVFTSGGVGPTHDDVTIEAVAKAFEVDVVTSTAMEELLRGYYGDRILEGHLLMARVPEGARLVSGGNFPWPTIVMQNVWVLPGVPEIFKKKLPLIRSELGGGTPFVSLAVLTNLDEGQLKPLIDGVVSGHPDVDVGSYPKWNDPEYRTKLTFDGLELDRVREARDAFVASLPPGGWVRNE